MKLTYSPGSTVTVLVPRGDILGVCVLSRGHTAVWDRRMLSVPRCMVTALSTHIKLTIYRTHGGKYELRTIPECQMLWGTIGVSWKVLSTNCPRSDVIEVVQFGLYFITRSDAVEFSWFRLLGVLSCNYHLISCSCLIEWWCWLPKPQAGLDWRTPAMDSNL